MTRRSSAVGAWLEPSNCSCCIREVTENSIVSWSLVLLCYSVNSEKGTPNPTQPNRTQRPLAE